MVVIRVLNSVFLLAVGVCSICAASDVNAHDDHASSEARCGTLPHTIPASLVQAPGWVPDLEAVRNATSFPHLRWLLSGRKTTASRAGGLRAVLVRYKTLHADMLAGRVPLRAWIVQAPRAGHGLGDRIRMLRLAFYAAVASGRALFLEEWGLRHSLEPHSIDWRLHTGTPAGPHGGGAPYLNGSFLVLKKHWYGPIAAVDTVSMNFVTADERADYMALAFGWAFSSTQVVRAQLRALNYNVSDVERAMLSRWEQAHESKSFRLSTWGDPSTMHECPPAPGLLSSSSAFAFVAPFHGFPLQSVLDYMFKPCASFLAGVLLPGLRAVRVWSLPGPRVGVHVRTFEADDWRLGSNSSWREERVQPLVHSFLPCLQCMSQALSTGSVFVISDSPAVLAVMRDTLAPAENAPSGNAFQRSSATSAKWAVSSVLDFNSSTTAESSRVSFHIGKPHMRHRIPGPEGLTHQPVDAQVTIRNTQQLLAEWIALSCVDAVVYNGSGLSSTSVLWAGLPVGLVRKLPRHFFVVDQDTCASNYIPTTMYVDEKPLEIQTKPDLSDLPAASASVMATSVTGKFL